MEPPDNSEGVPCPSCKKEYPFKAIKMHIKRSADKCEEKMSKDTYNNLIILINERQKERKRKHNKKYQSENFYI